MVAYFTATVEQLHHQRNLVCCEAKILSVSLRNRWPTHRYNDRIIFCFPHMVQSGAPYQIITLLYERSIPITEIDTKSALNKYYERGALITGYPVGALLTGWMDTPLHFEGIRRPLPR